MQTWRGLAVTAVGMALLGAAGCHVDETKNGDNKDVKIATPFGGMHVKTNDAVAPADLGIAVYPGAVPVKKDNGNDDNSAADVNMSFGGFQLRIKAASYRTNDAPDKVEAFYRNDLKRYGDVIACENDKAIGTPVRTAEGLTCNNKKDGHITVENNVNGHKMELKTGSRQHQHVVGIDPDGSGTKLGLVVLDLPGRMFSDGGDGRQ